jgi:hypothetical protein
MDYAIWPSNVQNLEAALRSIDIAYKMNHNPNDNIGSYQFEKDSDNIFKIICDNPYPCVFDQGILMGVTKKFHPNSLITHGPESCREKNGNHCTYTIKVL